MKSFRSTGIVLVLALALGGWIWFNERGPIVSGSAEVLWRVEPASVQSLQLQNNGKPIELRKRGDDWQVSTQQRAPLPADATAVQALLDAVQLLQSDAVTTLETSKLKEYGLDAPQSTLIVNGTQKLELGNRPSFDTTKIYARAGNRIALLPASLHESITRPLEAWRDKAILRFEAEKVTRVVILAPAIWAEFVRSKIKDADTTHAWNIAEPLQARAEADTIESFLSQIATAKTSKFLDDNDRYLDYNPQTRARWGLDKPLAVLKLSGDKDNELIIGRKVSGGYAAQNITMRGVFLHSDATFGIINRPLRDWRSKTPLPIDLNALSQVEIRARGAIKSFTKQNDRWQAQAAPAQSPLDSTHEAVTDILFAAQNLSAVGFIDKPTGLSTYGLDKPLIEIAFDKDQKRLAVGRRDGKIYARAGEGDGAANRFAPTVFVLNESASQEFQTGLNILFPTAELTPAKSGKVNTKAVAGKS